jgi:ABC-type uncharacterized transport system auxiliary subunit
MSGCLGRKSVMQNYYLLELPAVADSSGKLEEPVSDASCILSPVVVHSAFSSHRIAVRTQSHELNYYGYHQWAVRPDESFSKLLIEFFEQRAVFADIVTNIMQPSSQYRLATEIDYLEVVQVENNLLTHLSLSCQLLDNASGEVVLFHEADRRVPLATKNLNHFAAAVSDIFYQELHQFSTMISSYFENQTK